MIRLLLFLLGILLVIFLFFRIQQLKKRPKLVLLDRDGVINEDRHDYVKSLEEFEFIPGSIEAIKMLNDAGIKVIVVTNQGGIGRTLYTREDLEEIHQYMKDELEAAGAHVDEIFFCADHPDSPTHRRKPNPGMLEEALTYAKTNPTQTHMVGDSVRDMVPAFTLGIHRHLVLTGHGQKSLEDPKLKECFPVQVHETLLDAVKEILKF